MLDNLIVNEDSAELKSFVEGAMKIMQDHMAREYPNNPVEHLEAAVGVRYVKVLRVGICSAAVHCFIDRRNGDVLKPASAKAPAKHARGNIFDAQNGLGSMGPWGPAYLK